MSPQSLYVEALVHNMTLLGDGAFGQYVGLDDAVKMKPHNGVSVLKWRGRKTRALFMHIYQGKVIWDTREKDFNKPGSRLLPGTPSTMILHFLASNTVRNECLLFKWLSIWYFVIVALAALFIPFYI